MLPMGLVNAQAWGRFGKVEARQNLNEIGFAIDDRNIEYGATHWHSDPRSDRSSRIAQGNRGSPHSQRVVCHCRTQHQQCDGPNLGQAGYASRAAFICNLAPGVAHAPQRMAVSAKQRARIGERQGHQILLGIRTGEDPPWVAQAATLVAKSARQL